MTNKAPLRSFIREGAPKSVFTIELVDDSVSHARERILPAVARRITRSSRYGQPHQLALETL